MGSETESPTPMPWSIALTNECIIVSKPENNEGTYRFVATTAKAADARLIVNMSETHRSVIEGVEYIKKICIKHHYVTIAERILEACETILRIERSR